MAKPHAFLYKVPPFEVHLLSKPSLNLGSDSTSKLSIFLKAKQMWLLWRVSDNRWWVSCRFENAVAAAEKAGLIDFSNIEIAMLLNNVKLVIRTRSRGKDLFNSGRFSDACIAYGEGLKCDLSNSVLYCNRAVCWSKLELWDESVEDCNRALKIQPNYTKALLRRAVSNAKVNSCICIQILAVF